MPQKLWSIVERSKEFEFIKCKSLFSPDGSWKYIMILVLDCSKKSLLNWNKCIGALIVAIWQKNNIHISKFINTEVI